MISFFLFFFTYVHSCLELIIFSMIKSQWILNVLLIKSSLRVLKFQEPLTQDGKLLV